MKRLYYSFSLLALIATNCLGNKKNTTSTKPSRSNQNKSAPVKRKKESGINKKSNLGCTAVNTSNLESKKDTKDVKDVKDIKNINEIDKSGYTLLAIAVDKNDTEQVKKLLELGANPNISNKKYDHNILYTAVRKQNKEIVSLLLSHGAEVVFDENGESSVIREAAGEGAIGQEILDIIFCHFADIGKKDSVGLSPIHWACRDGHVNVVKHILNKDRSLVNDTNNLYGFTPLHWAARRGFKEIVEVLISKGASKTAKSRSGFTPLMLAISNRHETLKDILSSDGFSRQSKRLNIDWQCSICLEGLEDSRDKIFPVIPLECGHKFHFRCISSNVVEKERHGESSTCPNCRAPLSEDIIKKIVDGSLIATASEFSVLGAVIDKDLTKLRSLLEKGGNPNESSIANNALQEAVNQHNYEMVCLLLDYGADPTYRDPGSNSTPLHEAVSNMYFQRTSEDISNKICIALIQNGALVNSKNVDCDTPKDKYCTNKDPLFVIAEAGGIRSGWVTDINPAFGLLGDSAVSEILFNKVKPPHTYG